MSGLEVQLARTEKSAQLPGWSPIRTIVDSSLPAKFLETRFPITADPSAGS
jgi:hypothetical protein